MLIQKLLLLRVFCYDHFESDDFKVTYLPKRGEAIVEVANGDCILLVAKENNIVECYEDNFNKNKPFGTYQFLEGFYIKNSLARFEYGWKVLK